ncbi:MAG: extracellular solute-binding protein [Paenibacillus dendritiformis]|uniref:extracellular solute-binding protein n=1 Tax=Paenibacillus dendritiformis TaxID=130049 RepID=UPI00143D9DC5|nr:extracellular solute-binding protein [Paenibacillus dendritiformis]MDU5144531.1 extracellular solute-binding protein [Paenibacillus dendritiformis]NKI24729.1 extracellular solute-binding protein [Paenibacillus dendritiformis]NRG00577.1 extracellular solute-binding protein [Paenibacillus dendritiformis]
MRTRSRNTIFIWTLLLSLVFVSTLAGCGSKQGASPPGGETPAAAEENEISADPLWKYPEPVKVTQVIGYGAPEDPKTPKGTTPATNAYLKKLKEMLNIEVEFLWQVPSDQAQQKFSLAIASGDLPDVFEIGITDYEKFKEDDMLEDLTEAYEKYASPELKAYVEADGGKTLEMYKIDGKILALPNFEDPFMSAQILWLRKDWLDKLKLGVPQTMDELERVAEAFVNQDPDGNGKKDTYGIAFNKDLISWGFDARGFFYSMGAYPKAWIKNAEGALVPGEIQPETKAALERMNQWYSKGLIDKEFAFKDIDKVVEDVVAGKVGISFGEWWYPNWPLNMNRDQNPEAEWIAVPIPSYDGKPGQTLIPSQRLSRIYAVRKGYEHPEAIIKMANFYLELEKPKYKDEVKAENGYVYNWYQPRFYNPFDFETAYTEVNEALKNKQEQIALDNPTSVEVFEAATKYLQGDQSMWGMYTSRAAEDGGWGITRQLRGKPYVVNEFYGTATPTMTEKSASLNKMTDEMFTKMIMGSAPISEFDKYAESWKKLGGQDIIDEVNEWHANK